MAASRLPFRYVEFFRAVLAPDPSLPTVAISVPPYARAVLSHRWECRRCGLRLKPNNAGAVSHLAKHCRAIERARRPE